MQAITNSDKQPRNLVGWREWISLPELGITAIKAKIDTGAKTSALDAFDIKKFKRNGQDFVNFVVHPLQLNSNFSLKCEAPLLDQRIVTNSGGTPQLRYVIQSIMTLAEYQWPIHISLTNRHTMRFRMLIGRRALIDRTLVDPSASYLCGKLDAHKLYAVRHK